MIDITGWIVVEMARCRNTINCSLQVPHNTLQKNCTASGIDEGSKTGPNLILVGSFHTSMRIVQ